MILQQLGNDELAALGAILETAVRTGTAVLQVTHSIIKSQSAKRETLNRATRQQQLANALAEYCSKMPFNFKGNETDLSYFWRKSALPVSEINALDDTCGKAVRHSFSEMAAGGLVRFNDGKTALVLTDKGKEYVSDPKFAQRVFRADLEQTKTVRKAVSAEMVSRQYSGKADDEWLVNKDALAARINEAANLSRQSGNPQFLAGDRCYLKVYYSDSAKPNTPPNVELYSAKGEIVHGARASAASEYSRELDNIYFALQRQREFKIMSSVPSSGQINYDDGVVNNTNEIIAEAGKRAVKPTEKAAAAALESSKAVVKESTKAVLDTTAAATAGTATMGITTAAEITAKILSSPIKIIKNKTLQ